MKLKIKMMNDKQFKELSKKLDTLIKLTAINALRDRNLTDQIGILSEIGLMPKEIAAILGTDPATVRTLKSRVKKRKANKKEEETTPRS
jgi:hypothetical protein